MAFLGRILRARRMRNRSPYGNLTAALVVVAFLELVVNRLLGRLFISPGCRGGLGCLLLQCGPFLLHLSGVLSLVVAAGAVAGHLKRGELFPRGMRLTVAGLSLVFLLLLALSLAFGRMPERYHIHLETSFGFILALLVLSFVGSRAGSAATRVGFILFAVPSILHVAALVASRAGWLRHSAVNPARLTFAGEVMLLLAAAASPLLFLRRRVPRGRIFAGAGLAAGMSAFFLVAFFARTDLVQTVALYGLHLELPRPLSLVGLLYALGLFGFLTTAGVLLLSGGASRLTGLGLCLIALAGYQTASPVALAISLCGQLALATGALRSAGDTAQGARLSLAAWRSLLSEIASGTAEPSPSPSTPGPSTPAASEPVVIEVMPGGDGGNDGDSDIGSVRAPRRGKPVAFKLRRVQGAIRELDVTVGTPGDGPPDATIESHEAWLGRRPEDRAPGARAKTGDPTFDRKLSVHGRAPLHDRALRRRVLRLTDGTVTLWIGRGARFVAPGSPTETLHRFALPATPSSARSLVELADTLIELVDAVDPSPEPESA